MRAVVESCECFVRMLVSEPTPANPVRLRLQVLESDHIDVARNGLLMDGTPTQQGISLDDAGAPVAYWLYRMHPGVAWLMPGMAAGLLRDAQGRSVESFEPGMILYRRGTGSVDVVNPSAGGSHQAFARRTLEAAAVSTGLTYDQAAGDLTAANYSSLRAGKIEFRRLSEQVQYGMPIPMPVRPIADRFHAQDAAQMAAVEIAATGAAMPARSETPQG